MMSPKKQSAPDEEKEWKPTERDKRIIAAVHAFDGMLGVDQVRRLFAMGRTQAELRLKLLHEHGFLARPDRKKRAALDTMIYWLDKDGASYLAGLAGVENLKEFPYRDKPHWQLVPHDLWVNDIRISVMKGCEKAGLILEHWITELEFWRYPRDKVTYPDEQGRTVTREVRPDGLFSVLDEEEGYRWRFLLEVDRSTEDNVRMAEEKYLPDIYYLKSDGYAKRIGSQKKVGRWLYIATSERRLKNMKRRCETVTGNLAEAFYFTTYELANDEEAVFSKPIWWRGGDQDRHLLLER